jgi:competence protein ComEA
VSIINGKLAFKGEGTVKNKEKLIGSVVILCIFIIFLTVGFYREKQIDTDNKEIFVDKHSETKESDEKTVNKLIKVEIKGEVKTPGVYTLSNTSRVEDLIAKAGGFTEGADTVNLVSLAKKLRDEECIIVRRKQEQQEKESFTVAAGVLSGRTTEGKININTASKEELKTVPGIGEVTAQKIIDYREKHGDFNSVEELKKIDRIGDKTLSNIRDKIDAR